MIKAENPRAWVILAESFSVEFYGMGHIILLLSVCFYDVYIYRFFFETVTLFNVLSLQLLQAIHLILT